MDAGWRVDRGSVCLIRKRERLQVPKNRHKKCLLMKSTIVLQRADYPNHFLSYDFVFYLMSDGRTLKHLTVVNEFTYEGLMIEVAPSITSGDVICVLDYLFDLYGTPTCIKSGNGPEFEAKRVQTWL